MAANPQKDPAFNFLIAPASSEITIALDGYAGCGKTTLAKDLSLELAYALIDTGAMYRTITWRILEESIPLHETKNWDALLDQWPLEFITSQSAFTITYRGRRLEDEIRTLRVSESVSEVSAHPGIRAWLVKRQQILAKGGGVILEGRDIGTVVSPGAEVRLFITASLAVRVERRFRELQQLGMETDRRLVEANLVHRDAYDTGRKDSPLQPAPGVLWMDTSRMTRQCQLKVALEVIEQQRGLQLSR